MSHEFTDVWRGPEDRYLTVLPDTTFVKAYGLDKHVAEAVEGALRVTGHEREDIAKIVLYGPDARIGKAGNTGSASCLLGLAAALEECWPGDQWLVVSYGSGAEALLFQCTDALARAALHRPVSAQLAQGKPLAHYGKLLSFRRHVETEVVRSFSKFRPAGTT